MGGGLLPRGFALHLVRVGRRWPKTVLVGAAIACLVAGAVASRFRVETDMLSLMPADNQAVVDFTTTIERFGSVDTLLVVVRVPDRDDLEPLLAFSEIFATGLRDWSQMSWIEYRLEAGAEAAIPLLDRATLFVAPEEVDGIVRKLRDDRALELEMSRIRSELLAPQSVVTKELLRLDPLGLLPMILDRVRLAGIGVTVDPETRCLMDPERRFLLMLAKPVGPAQDLEFDRDLVAGLEERRAEAVERWRAEGFEGDPPEVHYTGGYIIALDDSQLITRDAAVGAVSSLVGVMILFVLAFRRLAALAYAVVPLLTGLGLAIAFVGATMGRLNALTAASGGLLIGLGVDFIIVLYARYAEERCAGRPHDEAIDAMGRHTGVSVLLGAVTTAATFYAFLATDFRGLSELGLLTGTGILLLLLSVLLLVPALLTVAGSRDTPSGWLALRSFGSDRLCQLSLRRPRATLVIAAVVTVGLAVALGGLEFDDDINNLRSTHNPGSMLRDEVMEAFGLRFSPMTVRIDGADEEQVLAAARRLLPDLRGLVDGETLVEIDTIADVIPPVEVQRQVIERLEAADLSPAEVEDRLRRGLRGAGLNPDAFSRGIAHIEASLTASRPLGLADLEGTTLERVVDRYLVRHADGVSLAVYCYPPAGSWRRAAPPALAAVVKNFPGAVLTGPNVVSAELRRIVWRDALRAAVIGMIAVFVLIWLDLGSPVRAALALLPLGVGFAWMLGAMGFLGLRLNFMNIFVFTMIIGIGVDYGLHLLHRWYESGGRPEAVAETAKAIAVAAFTTMVGFGSLVLSHFPGLRSVGAAAILGALCTACASITVLPVVLRAVRRPETAGGRGDER